MREVVLLFKRTGPSAPETQIARFRQGLEAEERSPQREFSTAEEYRQLWWQMLIAWLESVVGEEVQA
jgi:hypothetical protein